MAGFEIGLYGQAERTIAQDNAFQERILDVEAETRQRGRTEIHFRRVMARIVLAEMASVREERRLLSEHFGSEENPMGWLGDFLLRVCQIPHARQRDCLNRLGKVAEQMLRDGYHQQRVYTAINCAVPMALEMRRNRNAKAEQGDRPRSRVGRSATVYKIPEKSPLKEAFKDIKW